MFLAFARNFLSFFLITTISLFAYADSSKVVCSSPVDCDLLKEKLNEALQELLTSSPLTFLDVEKDSKGQPLLLTQAEAIVFCSQRKAYLPSVLEMTVFATLQGAPEALSLKDIYEKYEGEVPAGFKNIKSVNSVGVKENFYYSKQGYKKPADALKTGFLWTSSTLSKEKNDAFLFFGESGAIIYGQNIQNAKSSFLCVQK